MATYKVYGTEIRSIEASALKLERAGGMPVAIFLEGKGKSAAITAMIPLTEGTVVVLEGRTQEAR